MTVYRYQRSNFQNKYILSILIGFLMQFYENVDFHFFSAADDSLLV